MNIETMSAAVLFLTQFIKDWRFMRPVNPVWISMLVALFVVGYEGYEQAVAFSPWWAFTWFQVVAYANGGHKLLKVVAGTRGVEDRIGPR